MTTVFSSPASISTAFEQVEGLLIILVALLGPPSLLAMSMGQLWPMCLVETTFVLGTILGAARFVNASDDFESGDPESSAFARFLGGINAQSRALLNS